MDVTLHDAAPQDLHVVRNLVPYYVYDMSEYLGWACFADGRFDGCDELARFWTAPRRYAFVMRAGDEWAGFALVRGDHAGDDDDAGSAAEQNRDVDYSIGEFFVLRKFRRRGVGQAIAWELFDRFRGRWMIEPLTGNVPAVAFWQNVVRRYCHAHHLGEARSSSYGDTTVLRFDNTSMKMTETEFWQHLEFALCGELDRVESARRRGMWCDGFIVDDFTIGPNGTTVGGKVWIGFGPREQEEWTFRLHVEGVKLRRADADWCQFLPGDDETGWAEINTPGRMVTIRLHRMSHAEPETG